MRGVLGVLWEPTLLPSHFQCAVVFKDGLVSASSRVLEARLFNGLKGATCYEAPGYPSVLFVGEPVIELLDAMYPGRPKEAAGIDPFGRVCIEAKAPNMNAVDGVSAVEFVAPVFRNPHIIEDPREVLSRRRIA
jgi:hypothetical protein